MVQHQRNQLLMVTTSYSVLNVYCPESPSGGRVCPMVGSNSDCRHSCGVYYHEKLPMQVNSSCSFSSGPKIPWCSVLLLIINRA